MSLPELFLSPSSPSSRHPGLDRVPTSLFIDMGIALIKHLMQLACMEGGVDPAAMCFVCSSQLFVNRFQGFPEQAKVEVCIIRREKGDIVLVTLNERGLWSTLCS